MTIANTIYNLSLDFEIDQWELRLSAIHQSNLSIFKLFDGTSIVVVHDHVICRKFADDRCWLMWHSLQILSQNTQNSDACFVIIIQKKYRIVDN